MSDLTAEELELFYALINEHHVTAGELGVDKSTLYRYKKREKRPSRAVFERLVELLKEKGVSITVAGPAGFEPATVGLKARRSTMPSKLSAGNFSKLPARLPGLGDLEPVYLSEVQFPVSDYLLQEFVEWACNVKDRRLSSRTAKYYASLVKRYADIVKLPRLERLKLVSALSPKLRSWIKDAMSCYAKFLDCKYNMEEPYFVDVVKKRLADVKRYRCEGAAEAPDTEQVVEFIRASKGVSTKFYTLLLTKLFTGLRYEHLKLLNFNEFVEVPGCRVFYQRLYRPNGSAVKPVFVAALPEEVLAVAREHGVEKPTYMDYQIYKDHREVVSRTGIHIRLHDLRHFMATYLLAQGVKRDVINFLQGRKPVEVDLKHYVDWLQKDLAKAWAAEYRRAVEPLLERLL